MVLSLFLSLVACQPDPLQHPDFLPPTEGGLRIELQAPVERVRVGGGVDLVALVTTRDEERSMVFDSHENTLVGRSGLDTWMVRLEGGWEDPSPWWEDSAPRRMPPKPFTVSTEAPFSWAIPLDEWVRFDQPGTYAVQLESIRASGKVVRSNKVAIKVSGRDGEADRTKVKELLDALTAATGAERAAIFRDLATVGSDETWQLALEQLAKGPEDESGWVLVLAMHPSVEALTLALNAAIEGPDVPVGMGHLRALEALVYDEEFEQSVGRLPPNSDLPGLEAHREKTAARTEFREASRKAAWDRLWKAIDAKSDTARGRSLGTLALFAIRGEMSEEEAFWPVLRRDLAKVPGRTLVELLGRYWDEVSDPDVVPALVTLVGAPSTSDEARSAALQRLVQLDVSAGQAVIEALVADPNRKVTEVDDALRALPSVSDATQRALVEGLATATNRVQQVRLLAQYVSADHMAAVEAAWKAEPADIPTEVLAGYAAYFQNHDPAKARPLLAMWTTDRHMLLEYVGELVQDPTTLNPLAMKGLRNSEQAIIFKSSDYLIEHGTPDLLPELVRRVPTTKALQQEGLFGAICAGRNWMFDEATRLKISQQLTDKRSDMILRSTHASDAPFVLLKVGVRDGEPVMQLNYREYYGREAVGAKLKQFRPGMVLKLTWQGVSPEQGEAVFRPLVEAAGVQIFKASTP